MRGGEREQRHSEKEVAEARGREIDREGVGGRQRTSFFVFFLFLIVGKSSFWPWKILGSHIPYIS